MILRSEQEDDRAEASGHHEEVLAERGALPCVSRVEKHVWYLLR